LTNGINNLVDKCIKNIAANRERAAMLIENSLAMCTILAPIIGYDKAAKIAQEAYDTGKTVREIAQEQKILSEDELTRLLDPLNQTGR